MKVVTYTCDRCKASDTSNKIDLISLNLSVFYIKSIVRTAEWCRKCLEETGILEISLKDKEDIKLIKPPPTLEDIIREIVREEIQQ